LKFMHNARHKYAIVVQQCVATDDPRLGK
jgi:hypothetical protein